MKDLMNNNNKQVLIIEPDETLRTMLSSTLAEEGFEVTATDNVENGLQIIQESHPKVIVSEWKMPVIDGPTLCTIIKSDQSVAFSYFIALVSAEDIKNKIAGLATEADDYLLKPFLPEEFKARIKVGLRTCELERELLVKDRQIEKITRSHKWDLSIASKVQKTILRLDYPTKRGLKFSSRYLACATLNGDMFDIFARPDGKTGILIADVSGHGASASLITILFRSLFRSPAFSEDSPAKALIKVNQTLLTPLEDLFSFITAAYVIFDPETKKLAFSTAAHPPIILIRQAGEIEYLEAKGMMLGMFSDFWCHEGSVRLQTGDHVLLYTDGVIEQKNSRNECFGATRIEAVIQLHRHKPPEEIIDNIVTALWQFAEGAPIEDDYTLLLIEVE